MGSICVGTQRLYKASLGCGEEFREHGEVTAASRSELERGMHVDPNYVSARRKPQLALAGEQNIPGLVLLIGDQGVLSVGAALPVDAGLAFGAGEAVVAAGSAVLGPSARLEMPAAEGPDNDMDASR
jgi:hypothetical protein